MRLMVRKQYRVYGIVQGVGFRPFVARIARETGVTGSVCNKGPYVEIYVQGDMNQVGHFKNKLITCAPERSSILKVESNSVQVVNETVFSIIQSEKTKGDIFVSPDIAICPTCQKELFDPNDRRYLHPFINCTACGPRLTILDSMPYDRIRTSMGEFPMCPDCEYEYTHESTRRYHAQPVCCNVCGPELYVLGKDIRGKDALIHTREIIRKGGIAAIKGIGGFHLCCDAANEQVVQRLRILKRRPFKPFAVMVKDEDVLQRECIVDSKQMRMAAGPERPILLLKKKSGRICSCIAPDNPNVGIMLPYAPVQMLLFEYPDEKEMTDCFVMTSANPTGAPICKDDADVIKNLGDMCDVILSNDRKIRLRADDSVMSWFDSKPYMIRRSRGYAPLPFMLSNSLKGSVLGIGGELKNTFCLAKDDLYYPSPYIGDLSDVRSVEVLKQTVTRMCELLEIQPSVIACDMHPHYNSTRLAQEFDIPVVYVQHHYAHILSCMAENDYFEKVIGVSFDGTGYGSDGSIWGGEFLVCDTHDFKRVDHIASFDQIGGDRSSMECWRIAASILSDHTELIETLNICTNAEFSILQTMKQAGINTVSSTSAGRLFDAMSCILGLRKANSCEAEASMVLEFTAGEYKGDPIPIRFSDTNDLLIQLAHLKAEGNDVSCLAYTFHYALAQYIVDTCVRLSRQERIDVIALSGGVMQNILLLELCRSGLEKKNLRVLTQSMEPSNDGGIGLGQALYAMQYINSKEED